MTTSRQARSHGCPAGLGLDLALLGLIIYIYLYSSYGNRVTGSYLDLALGGRKAVLGRQGPVLGL